jgi:thiamine-phosphate pyrophosphorylase
VRDLAPVADFFAFGAEVWSGDEPLARLRALDGAIG